MKVIRIGDRLHFLHFPDTTGRKLFYFGFAFVSYAAHFPEDVMLISSLAYTSALPDSAVLNRKAAYHQVKGLQRTYPAATNISLPRLTFQG